MQPVWTFPNTRPRSKAAPMPRTPAQVSPCAFFFSAMFFALLHHGAPFRVARVNPAHEIVITIDELMGVMSKLAIANG